MIDVFRAMTVEAFLMSRGVKKLLPVGDVQVAWDYKANHPDAILCGERGGAIIEGFHFGNSPSAVEPLDFTGKTVVHTTSAGTQGIANAIYADEILGAGLVNARATAEYIRRSGAEEVSLVCMGLEALAPTEEDTLCAEYIKHVLENRPMDLKPEIESLRHTSGAKFFDPAQCDVFPMDDFAMCTDADRFDFVLKLITPQQGLPYMMGWNV